MAGGTAAGAGARWRGDRGHGHDARAVIARVQAWFGALTGRERGMVSLALALALLVGVGQGVLLPLRHAWLAARDDHVLALARSARLLRQLAETQPRARITSHPDAARLMAGAARTGVRLQPPVPQGNGFALAGQGPSAAVLAWLESLRDQGLMVRRVALVPLAEGGVSCEARVVPAGGFDRLSPNGE
nr:type II secretion system protein GspM [Novosphingobium sp. SG720]